MDIPLSPTIEPFSTKPWPYLPRSRCSRSHEATRVQTHWLHGTVLQEQRALQAWSRNSN
jgi:hypothetical protein